MAFLQIDTVCRRFYRREMHHSGPSGTASPANSERTPVRAAVFLRNIGVFLAVCTLACVGLRAALPFPRINTIGTKYRYFAKHRDDYDVLFIGSSRFYHQIIPPQFDAAVSAAGGRKIRSFNISCDALWPPESCYYLEKVLALRPKNLRWVFMELMDINPRIGEPGMTSDRDAYWHDLPRTRMAWAALAATPVSTQFTEERKRQLAVEHGWQLAEQWVNFGRGAQLLTLPLASRKSWDDRSGGSDHAGDWLPTAGYKPEGEKPISGEELSHLLTNTKRLLDTGLDPAPPSPILHEAMRHAGGQILAAKAQPIFAITPTTNSHENITSLPEGWPIFAFNDPQTYPQLFEPAAHFDEFHLNHSGAVEFTDLLAQRFSEYLKQQPAATPAAGP